jgi:hypothetical protein
LLNTDNEPRQNHSRHIAKAKGGTRTRTHGLFPSEIVLHSPFNPHALLLLFKMKSTLVEIRDLLEFQIKQAKRHDLCQITITVPRAVSLLHSIRQLLKENKTRTEGSK